MKGKTLSELQVFPNEADLLELRARFAGGELTPSEVRVRRKGGEQADFLITGGSASFDGEPCAISIWHDISELRRRDAALRESGRQAGAIFEMAPVGIAVGDPHSGCFLTVNKRFCDITGYSAEEMRGMPIARLNHPADSNLSPQPFLAALRGEISEFHVDRHYLRKDGETARVSVDVTMMRNEKGEATHTLAVVEDVTQVHKAEQQLREAQHQLQAAQKMEATGQLAGGIAHDFNNLLTVILSYTELALEELSPELAPHDYLTEVTAAGNRAKALTTQLLASVVVRCSRWRRLTLAPWFIPPRAWSLESISGFG